MHNDTTRTLKIQKCNTGMDNSQKDRKLIKVTNCRVLKEHDKDDAHIFLNNHSQIANLLRKFHILDHPYAGNKPIRISEIRCLSDMSKVTTNLKVVNVKSPDKITTQFGKEG